MPQKRTRVVQQAHAERIKHSRTASPGNVGAILCPKIRNYPAQFEFIIAGFLIRAKAMIKQRTVRKRAWNKGIELGQKDAFTPDQVKRIRNVLASRGDQGLRDLALFSVAIDTMLQGPELLNLTVTDVRRSDGNVRSVIEVKRRGRKPPLLSALSKVSANALRQWIVKAGKKRTDYIFSGRGNSRSSHPMTVRQLSRLLREWVSDAGLDPKKYGIESLRRTKALHILNATGDIEAVRVLLGHTKIESTARYLLIAKRSDPIAISRTYNI